MPNGSNCPKGGWLWSSDKLAKAAKGESFWKSWMRLKIAEIYNNSMKFIPGVYRVFVALRGFWTETSIFGHQYAHFDAMCFGQVWHIAMPRA